MYDDDEFERRPPRRLGRYRPTSDECSSASTCHLLGIFTGFIGPLIMWSTKKDQSRFVDFHGREALNFSLNILIFSLIATLILTVVTVVTCGFGGLAFPLVFLVNIYAIVKHVGMMNEANAGKWTGYGAPFQILGPPEGMDIGPTRRRRSADDLDWDEPDEPMPRRPLASSDAPDEEPQGSLLWLWVLGGIAVLLVGGCVIGGVVLYVVTGKSTAPRTTPTFSPAPPVFINPPVNKPNENRPPAPAPPQLPSDVVERALVQMQSNEIFERTRAADSIANVKADHPRRADVMKALTKQLEDADRLPRDAAVRALAAWTTASDVALMNRLLEPPFTPGILERNRLIEKLGASKDNRAVKPLVAAMKDVATRRAATEALKKLGPMAEDELVILLRDNNSLLQRSVIDVLKVIGTKKSIDALQPLTMNRTALASRQAKDAIDAIKARHP